MESGSISLFLRIPSCIWRSGTPIFSVRTFSATSVAAPTARYLPPTNSTSDSLHKEQILANVCIGTSSSFGRLSMPPSLASGLRKTFRNSSNCERHGNFEVVGTPSQGKGNGRWQGTSGVKVELQEVMIIDQPHQEADDSDDLCEQRRIAIFLRCRGDRGLDLPYFSIHPDPRNNGSALAISNGRSREKRVFFVLQRHILSGNWFNYLLHCDRFASQG
eukprot:scaffold2859_cov349-Pavlova_lutheri.AAC.11